MQPVWRYARWLLGKLFFFLALLVTTVALVRLPALLVYAPPPPGQWSPVPHLALRSWFTQVWQSLVNLAHGHVVPAVAGDQAERFWRVTIAEIRPELTVTLELLGTALALGLLLGLFAGWMISRLGPSRLRKAAWGATTLVVSIPDLLIATLFDLALVVCGWLFHFKPFDLQFRFYQKYFGPSLALTLLIVPYIARVTAAAIEEITGQLYVRTAMAKGLHRGRVILVHVGKNVLIRVFTILPVVTGLLLSGTVMVEYMTETHGIGRGLMLLLAPHRPGYNDPYAALLKLLPLLVIVTLMTALSEAGLRWLDPRIAEPEGATVRERLRAARPRRSAAERWQAAVRLPGALREGLADWATGLREGLPTLPDRLKESLRALKDPVLLIGTLLVLALAAVAIAAPHLAPFAATHATPAYQDAQGRIYAAPSGPDSVHPFGTDQVGRDMLSVLLYGTRYALLFAAVVVPARFLLALLLGLAAAWRGGIWDKLLRWLGVFFSAVPLVIVPLVAIGVFNQAYGGNVAVCFAWGVFWLAMPAVPRLAGAVRQMALSVFASPFLESAVAAGAGSGRILFRHVLPQMKAQLVTMMALEVPLALTMTAALGYFGVAVGGAINAQEYGGLPAIPEWGSIMAPPVMIIMAGQWWLWTPFAALFIATLAFNLFGEGLRRRYTGTTEWRLQA